MQGELLTGGRIKEGDSLVIRRQESFKEGDIILVNMYIGLALKRVACKKDPEVLLCTIDSKENPIMIDERYQVMNIEGTLLRVFIEIEGDCGGRQGNIISKLCIVSIILNKVDPKKESTLLFKT
ncbi:S24 family peptidase [Bacillus paramycoides]|uniref:S24 family peptidase n=1 Tax=Bacillus paramycoides TaxID=2026194 RepID=UPI00399D3323